MPPPGLVGSHSLFSILESVDDRDDKDKEDLDMADALVPIDEHRVDFE